MKFAQNIHPTRLFGPTRLIGTWEYVNTKAELSMQLFKLNYLGH
jgi:hypothetical protein